MTPRNLQSVPSGPPPRLSFWSSLDTAGKAFVLLVTGVTAAAGASYALSSVVTATELSESQAPQDAAITRLDKEVEEQFRLQAILEQKVTNLEQRAEWSNEVLWRMARDLGLHEGRNGLKPPPAPTPVAHPTPVSTP